MNRRNVFATTIVAAALVTSQAVYAAPANLLPSMHAMFAKEKTIQLSLRNDSGSPMELRVGEELVKLDAGKSVSLKLPVGTKILATSNTPKYQEGSLIAEVSSVHQNATISIK